ncbi:hypothetical protein [Secundilactobacillus kimchicus]|uniref:Uncharacterized protein n=1 Tax=Secundilactobacillus kimchicus JCM 15530 TaxID=1302272 RepID=A0A0R1HR07_9LACO|nr:hypothetical protein [Secundilactobacillus kimchicus]KRK48908.1 hypothetical protein FC96_GL001229 [Secundilactobacillus kimchicus JCM 15530]MBT9671897.1 hypothetical protein [Secundilactobacillus kimchicus]
MAEDSSALHLGDSQLEKLMLFLKDPITEQNHLDYRFENSELRELRPGIWAMPAYLQDDDDFSLFFLFTTIETGDMVVAFAEGTRQEKQLALGTPMTTGAGLNLLNTHKDKRAVRVFKFLTDISRADEGAWRQITD